MICWMKSKTKCPLCEAVVEPKAEYCPECGETLIDKKDRD